MAILENLHKFRTPKPIRNRVALWNARCLIKGCSVVGWFIGVKTLVLVDVTVSTMEHPGLPAVISGTSEMSSEQSSPEVRTDG